MFMALTTKVQPQIFLTPNRKIRLDADYAIYMSSQASFESAFEIENIFTAYWMPKDDTKVTDPINCYYCEIADIDHYGRITPKFVDSNYTNVDPDTKKQLDRKIKKISEGKIGSVNSWAVLVPKTRVYQKKFGLVSGNEDCNYTTDLIVLQAGSYLLNLCGDKIATATCLLWILLKIWQIGDILAAVSRWGKSYPTLDIEDLKEVKVDRDELERWINHNNGIKRAEELVGIATEICNLDESIKKLIRLK